MLKNFLIRLLTKNIGAVWNFSNSNFKYDNESECVVITIPKDDWMKYGGVIHNKETGEHLVFNDLKN